MWKLNVSKKNTFEIGDYSINVSLKIVSQVICTFARVLHSAKHSPTNFNDGNLTKSLKIDKQKSSLFV